MRIIAARIIAVTLACFATVAGAATYYVSPTGSDSNNGTSTSTSFLTLQKGADVAHPGDTVIAMDGVYGVGRYTDRVLQVNNGGTAALPVTFRSMNRWGAVIDGQNYSAAIPFGVVLLDGTSSHTVIDGFQIRYINSTGIDIFGTSANPITDVKIVNNWIHHIGRIVIASCTSNDTQLGAYSNGFVSHVTWDSNVMHDIGRLPNLSCDSNLGSTPNYRHDHGLYLQGKYHTVTNNLFYNMFAGWAVKVDGFYGNLTNASDASHTISNNVFAMPSVPIESSGHIRIFANNPPETSGGLTMQKPVNVVISDNVSFMPPYNTGGNSPCSTFVSALLSGAMAYTGTVVKNNVTTASTVIEECVGSAITSKVTLTGNSVNYNLNQGNALLTFWLARQPHQPVL